MWHYVHDRFVRVLRWTEQYTKTDMVYLARGSAWLSSSSVITGAISFALALAFANLFTKDAYGTYKYIVTLFGILSVACLRGMDTVITQGVARGNYGTVVSGMHAKMAWSLLGSFAALCGAAYYYFYGANTVLAISLLIAAVFIPLMEPFGVFNAVLVGKRDFKLSSLLGIAGQVVAAAALALTLFLTDNPVVLFVVYAASWTLSRFLSLQLTLKKYPPNDQTEPGGLSYALHSSAINAINILIGSIDSILVFHYLGAAELAIYAFATAPVSHARALLNTPTVLAVPKLAGQTTAEVKRVLLKRTGVLFLMGAAVTLAYCVLAFPFYHILLPQYVDAIPLSLLFSITIFLQLGTALIGAVIESRVTLIPKRLLYLWNIPSALIAATSILLIPLFGLWGAIIGQVVSYASACAINWVLWYSIRNNEHPA